MIKANDYLINSSVVLDNVSSPHMRDAALSQLRTELEARMVGTKVEIREGKVSTEYRMMVYCFHPDEFWNIVREEAYRMSTFHNLDKMVETMTKGESND